MFSCPILETETSFRFRVRMKGDSIHVFPCFRFRSWKRKPVSVFYFGNGNRFPFPILETESWTALSVFLGWRWGLQFPLVWGCQVGRWSCLSRQEAVCVVRPSSHCIDSPPQLVMCLQCWTALAFFSLQLWINTHSHLIDFVFSSCSFHPEKKNAT